MGSKRRVGFTRGVAIAIASFIAVASTPSARGFAASESRSASSAPAQDEAMPSAGSLAREIQTALKEGREDRVRDVLPKLLKITPLDPDLLLRVGVALAGNELYAEAAQVFSRCVRDHPEIFEAYYNLALAEFAQQKLPEASRALAASPHGSEAEETARLYLRGKIEDALGQTSQAQSDLAAAFSRTPREENYALDLGLFYVRQRDYPRAMQVLERGVTANRQSPFLLLGLSLAQLLGGRNVESVETSKQALKLEPDFSPAQLLMVFALYLDGKLSDAERMAAKGLARPRPSPYLYYLHASLLLKRQSHDYDQVLEELAIARRAIPACSLCYLAESKAREAAGDTDAAIADLESAVRVDPGFSDAWYRLAILDERRGRPEDAARARESFERIKATRQNQETEMLRNAFLQTLSDPKAATTPHP